MLSKILKRLRENIGYTQQQVAEALHVERSTYTYYETGKTTPDINTIIKLAKIFGVSYVDLLNEEDRYNNARMNDIDTEEISFIYNKSYISDYAYELSKSEKRLLANYRVLSKEKQKEYLENICSDARKSN